MMRREEEGFTLIEVIIALAIASVLTAAIVLIYGSFHKETSCVELKLNAQQRARVAMSIMHDDILQIGANVPDSANPIEPGMSSSAVTLRYRDPVSDERVKVSYRLSGNLLEREYCNVAISFDDGSWNVCKTPTTYETLVGDIASINIEYLDADGLTTGDEEKVRFINLYIEALSSVDCVRQDASNRVKLETRIRLRNFPLIFI